MLFISRICPLILYETFHLKIVEEVSVDMILTVGVGGGRVDITFKSNKDSVNILWRRRHGVQRTIHYCFNHMVDC